MGILMEMTVFLFTYIPAYTQNMSYLLPNLEINWGDVDSIVSSFVVAVVKMVFYIPAYTQNMSYWGGPSCC